MARHEWLVADYQTLIQAIATLESQRELLTDAVVDTAQFVLRDRLAALPETAVLHTAERHAHLTVLVADLTDFTAMSAAMDAEQVRDTVNAVWEHLDGIVAAWGGQIDKHVGDSIVAYFGLPYDRPDDAERAIQAALEMQVTLDWLNRRNGRSPVLALPPNAARLGMRIGIHTGPVLLGPVGDSHDHVVMGEAVAIANHLEKAAPVGGVMISEEVYREVHGRFDVSPGVGVEVAERAVTLTAFAVEGVGPRPFREPSQQPDESHIRLVGRTAELETLRSALQHVSEARIPQVLVLTGPEGSGKSLLLDEFERWPSVFPVNVQVLRGRVFQQQGQPPFALLRDLFSAYFDIGMRYSTAVARENLVRTVETFLARVGIDGARAHGFAYAIGQVLGFDFTTELGLLAPARLTPDVLERACTAFTHLLRAVTLDATAVFLLEDIHYADPRTLDLLDYLVTSVPDVPALLVCTTEPQLLEERPSWQVRLADPFSAYEQLPIEPLSPIDSRHLANELLRNASNVPLRLLDLLATISGGLPFGITETVRLLTEQDLLVEVDGVQRIHMGQIDGARLPVDLPGVVQARLAGLPPNEQLVLQLAAVVGRLFPDTAVRQLSKAAGDGLSQEALEAVLIRLEERGLIFRSPTRSFTQGQEYLFRYEMWRAAAYASLAPEVRRACHAQTAYWLIAHCERGRLPTIGAHIAQHFALAGDSVQAALWNGRDRVK